MATPWGVLGDVFCRKTGIDTCVKFSCGCLWGAGLLGFAPWNRCKMSAAGAARLVADQFLLAFCGPRGAAGMTGGALAKPEHRQSDRAHAGAGRIDRRGDAERI